MNPSFKAFVDPPDGFHDKPGTPSKSEGQFSPPEARMAGEPRMQLFAPSAPAEKADFWFWAPKKGGFSERLKKKSRLKIFFGGRKFICPPNTITRRRRKKKKKKARFFRLGAEKYCSLGAAEKADFWFWAPKKNIGGRKCFGGGRKKYFTAEHHKTRRRRKINKYDFRPPKEQRPSKFLPRPS